MRLAHLLFGAAALLAATPVLAATDGTPGPTSTGTVTINASITPEVAISDLDDFTFTATQLQTALNTGAASAITDDICLWTNNVDDRLFVTATGDGAGGAFTLTDGTRTLPYTVRMSTTTGITRVLATGTKSDSFPITNNGPTCGGATNGGLSIILLNADIAAMEATTTYTGVLTLLVTPS